MSEEYCRVNNIRIDIEQLEKDEWNHIKKLAPLVVEEIKAFCAKNEIVFNDFWFDNRSMYDFFDERKIMLAIGIHADHTFFARIKGINHTCSLNGKKLFDNRYESYRMGKKRTSN